MKRLKTLLFILRLWATVIMLTIIQISCASFKQTTAVTEWIPSKNLPEKIGYVEDTEQPLVASDGVVHEITQCNVTQDRIFVKANFSSPYSQTLTGIVALTVDSEESGDVWGFYEVKIPSKRSATNFDTSLLNLTEEERNIIMKITEANAEKLVACSFHLIGFLDEGQYYVREPVAYVNITR